MVEAFWLVPEKHRARRTGKVFLQGVLRGLTAPANVYMRRRRRYPYPSSVDALRSDWLRVGNNMKSAAGELDERTRERQQGRRGGL